MLFVMTYKVHQATRNAAQDRFRKSGGLPPVGVKMLGRWHYVDGSGGVVLAESDDPVALTQWSQDWSDAISLETGPGVEDAQGAKMVGA